MSPGLRLPRVVATAGHVDHGKSTLLRLLTGIDTHHLPAERERGLTIDLGFAHLDLVDPKRPEFCFQIGFIDVPGHADFVRNMVAGVGAIDAALLVIAADDGWMPQTEEHLQILEYVGVTRGIVAVTKTDLRAMDSAFQLQIRARLQGSFLAEAPIVPIARDNSENRRMLLEVLAQVLHLAEQPPERIPRLFIDRVFPVRGLGTVVTGTLTGSRLDRSKPVTIQPGERISRVRALHNYGVEVVAAERGTRTAAALADLDRTQVRRGDVLFQGPSISSSLNWNVVLRCTDRIERKPSWLSVRSGSNLWVCYGSSSRLARVVFPEPQVELRAGKSIFAQIRFLEPVSAWRGDRFVIRDGGDERTLAGGLVLDPKAVQRHFRSSVASGLLGAQLAALNDMSALFELALRNEAVVDISAWSAAGGLEGKSSDVIVNAIVNREIARVRDGFAVYVPWLRQQVQIVADAVRRHHEIQPQMIGLALSEIRRLVSRKLHPPELFRILINELEKAGLRQIQNEISLARHRPSLPHSLDAACDQVRMHLLENPPPSKSSLAPDRTRQDALRFLCEQGEVVELNTEIYLPRPLFVRWKNAILRHLRSRGPASTSELRQQLGTSRRIAIALLEYLDRQGLTRRDQDLRTLR
ncbi:MAG: selenocysteine-specific translation elongation factor [Verrucomicrobia bacterium]|nr:selenocysteine-specific translation elongation factor [Verrucomicrobiota bacterium]